MMKPLPGWPLLRSLAYFIELLPVQSTGWQVLHHFGEWGFLLAVEGFPQFAEVFWNCDERILSGLILKCKKSLIAGISK